MSIIYCSDFDLRGSGYMNLAIPLCTQLAERGYDVVALGLGYKGEAHPYPFKIVPTETFQHFPKQIVELKTQKVDVEAIIVALDIPLHIQLLQQFSAPNPEFPYIGLFPLESGPLCQTWALHLLKMDHRLIMSEFGKQELAELNLDADFMPLTVNEVWFTTYTREERSQLRQGMGIEDEHTFVVLTVADNQERKNLSRSLEIFAEFAKDRPNSLYYLVTRPESPVGWRLEDYAAKLGIMNKLHIWSRGLDFKSLWSLYVISDCFLLTSKREGLAMPILEAMAVGLPCAGTNCAAIQEHLKDDRGYLINSEYEHIDPWGNSIAYMASLRDGVDKLKMAQAIDNIPVITAARKYVQNRTWQQCGDILEGAIRQVSQNRIVVMPPQGVVI